MNTVGKTLVILNFIFAVTAEELGLVGALFLVILFAIFLWRGVRTALRTQDTFGRFLAVGITRAVGSMWAAYIFVLIALVSFPQALFAFLNGDTIVGVTWLSQSFLQLVLLPILLVGQRVISAAQDARAETDHETLTALHLINVQQLEILETLAAMRKQQSQS